MHLGSWTEVLYKTIISSWRLIFSACFWASFPWLCVWRIYRLHPFNWNRCLDLDRSWWDDWDLLFDWSKNFFWYHWVFFGYLLINSPLDSWIGCHGNHVLILASEVASRNGYRLSWLIFWSMVFFNGWSWLFLHVCSLIFLCVGSLPLSVFESSWGGVKVFRTRWILFWVCWLRLGSRCCHSGIFERCPWKGFGLRYVGCMGNRSRGVCPCLCPLILFSLHY